MATSKTLKTLLFFTVTLTILSLIGMFVYTGKVSQKWKESLSEVLHLQNLSWIDTSELDLPDDGAFNDTLAETFGHIHQLQKGLSILNNSRPARKYGKSCPEKGSSQVGPLHVEYKSVPRMADIEKEMSSDFNGWVSKGGSWTPTDCQARVKMALIIPFRNRHEHLSIFVSHMHPFLKKQNLQYRIIVVEQAGDSPFNRAILFNIGYEQALNFDNYDCFIFHDVDLLPEDDRNEYSCPTSPRHMSVAVDTHGYRLMYNTIFGGVGAFSREHFELVNGFSNEFWGWGGEDDDLYTRISTMRLNLTRPSMLLGRYKMVKQFHSSGKKNTDRYGLLDTSEHRMVYDGLNTLNYTIKNLTEHRLYTLVTVYVNKAVINGEHFNVFSTLSVILFHLLASL